MLEPEATNAEMTDEPTSAPNSTESPRLAGSVPVLAIFVTMSAVAVPLPKTKVASSPAINAEKRLPRRYSMKYLSCSSQTLKMPVRTMRTPQSSNATPPTRFRMTNVDVFMFYGQGRDQVLTLV